MDRLHFWTDNRIEINRTHSYWQNQVDAIVLDGDFVQKCLWTTNLHIKNLVDLSVVRPTASSPNGSPVKVLLEKSNKIYIELLNIIMTIPCTMDFAAYPFDQQVGGIKG